MFQLDNIIEMLALSKFDALVFVFIVLLNTCGIGATFIDVIQSRFPIEPYSLRQNRLAPFNLAGQSSPPPGPGHHGFNTQWLAQLGEELEDRLAQGIDVPNHYYESSRIRFM